MFDIISDAFYEVVGVLLAVGMLFVVFFLGIILWDAVKCKIGKWWGRRE